MLYWLVRLLNRFRPRQGWLSLVLAWIAVASLPAAAIDGRLVDGLTPLLWLGTLGLFMGWWLAGRPLRGWAAALGLAGAGVVADLIWGVHALRIWPLFSQGARWLAAVIARGLGDRGVPVATVSYFADQWASLSSFEQRVGWWVQGLITGRGVIDNLVLVGLVCLLAWGVAAWAGWWLARHGRAFVALLPTGALLAQQVYTADTGTAWLLTFLGAVTLLLPQVRLEWLMQRWDAAGTDYSPEVRVESALLGVVIALLVVIMSPAVPVPSIRSISAAFWRVFEQPYRQFEERLEQSIPGVRPGRSLVPPAGVAAGGLPRSHLLGGRPELGDEVALRVQVRGARTDELLYWRGQTFAHYTGHGWEEDAAPLRPEFAAGEPWSAAATAGRHPVLSMVEVVAASRAVLYAAGEPVSADRPYHAIQRAPGELIALVAAGAPQHYAVLGEVATGDPGLLRGAGNRDPPQVGEPYLQLPDDLPVELVAYAAKITADVAARGGGRYDQALAIEAALRQIPYSLDVPTPPAGQEVVSWFLFDLRRGYCDYYATAMVVLARLSGIPARLAVGYATGSYDPRLGVFVVTELQAHSWPELHFPGYGWLPFEPTAARPLPERIEAGQPASRIRPSESPLELDAGLADLRQQADVYATAQARMTRLARWLLALNLLLLGRGVIALAGLHAAGAPYGEARLYARLARWGARLGRPPGAADTPREYATALAQVAERTAARARRPHAAASAAVVRAGALQLAQVFEASLYSSEPAPVPPSPQPGRRGGGHSPWAALWAACRRLWLARWGL